MFLLLSCLRVLTCPFAVALPGFFLTAARRGAKEPALSGRSTGAGESARTLRPVEERATGTPVHERMSLSKGGKGACARCRNRHSNPMRVSVVESRSPTPTRLNDELDPSERRVGLGVSCFVLSHFPLSIRFLVSVCPRDRRRAVSCRGCSAGGDPPGVSESDPPLVASWPLTRRDASGRSKRA